MQAFTIAYDDKTVTIDGEDLHVVYSIQHPLAHFRRDIMGPHSIRLYEKEFSHFGLVYIYGASCREDQDEHGDYHTTYTWRSIATPPERIVDALRFQSDELLKDWQ